MQSGARLGRYLLRRKLGQGGMAEVWEAFDEQLQRSVAAKIVLPNIAAEQEFRERFLREARLAASLEHPHILPIYDFGAEGETAFIVTPLLSGGSLRERLKDAVPIPQALEWLTAIASALDHAHRSGILHRDVTPANILFDKNGRALLCDFGLAKSAQGGMDLTMTGAVIGTPAFMSPEQGLGRQLDSRSDQFSLAVIAYRVLTGRLPFTGDTAVAVLHQTIFEHPPTPSTLVATLPEAVDDVIARALSKQPGDRYGNCVELVDAVKVAVGSSPTTPTFKIPPLPEGFSPAPRSGRTSGSGSRTGPTQRGTPLPLSGATAPTAVGIGTQPTVQMSTPVPQQLSSVPSRTMQSQTAATLGGGGGRSANVALILAGGALLLAGIGVVLILMRNPVPSPGAPTPVPQPAVGGPSGGTGEPTANPTSPAPAPPAAIGQPTPDAAPTLNPLLEELIRPTPRGQPTPEPIYQPQIIELATPTLPPRRLLPTAVPTTPRQAIPPPQPPADSPVAPVAPPASRSQSGPPPGPPADVSVTVRHGVKLDGPEQARVFLDGHYIGVVDDWDGHGNGAELFFDKEGRHRLRFAMAGKADFIADLVISSGAEDKTSDIEAKMKPGSPNGSTGPEGKVRSPDYRTVGPVHFKVTPPDAEVTLDGSRLGPASRYASEDLMLKGPAVHEIGLAAPGYLPLTLRVIVAPETDERAKIDNKLKVKK